MATRPGPSERVRIITIVFWPTGIEVVHQLLSRRGIKTLQVSIREGAQQQLRLIEPTGMGRGIERSEAGMGGEVSPRMMVNMRRPVIHDEMKAPGFPVTAFHLLYGPKEVI